MDHLSDKPIPIGMGDHVLYKMCRHMGDQYVYAFLDFDDRLERDRLLNAWRRLVIRVPVLRSVLHLDHEPPAFIPQGDFDPEPFLTFVEESDEHEARERQMKFCSQLIDPEQSTPLRLLAQNFSDRARLSFMCHHTSFDGGGLKAAVIELADCYKTEMGQGTAGEKALDTDRSEKPVMALKSGTRLAFAKHFLTDGLFTLSAGAHTSLWMDGVGIAKGVETVDPCYRFEVIGGGDFEALRAFAKGRGITVNMHLVCALLSAVRNWNLDHGTDNRYYPMVHTVDMRMYAPDTAGTFANLSSTIAYPVKATLIGDLHETIERVAPLLIRLKKTYPGLAGWKLINWTRLGLPFQKAGFTLNQVFRFMGSFSKDSCPLTNVGMIDPRAGDWGKVRAQSVHISGPAMPARSFLVTAAGFNGAITLTFAWDAAAMSRPTADEFIKFFLERVMAFGE